jgi:foldase protein PrsA
MSKWSPFSRSRKILCFSFTLLLFGFTASMVVADRSGRSTKATPSAGRASVPDGAATEAGPVVAMVNGKSITWRELAEECIARKGEEVLDTLISRLLVLQACDRQGVRVTAAEIDAEIGKTAKRLKMSREQFLKVIERERDIPARRYAEDVVLPGLALKKLAKPFVQVTQEDVERGFDAMYGEKVKCRWIMFDDQRTAMKIWDELKKTADTDGKIKLPEFEHQVIKYSTDVATRSIGGQINPISRHASVAFHELEEAAFAVGDSEISKVIQLGDSYVVIYRESLIPPQDAKLEDVRDQIELHIYEAKMREQVGRVFQDLKGHASVLNHLTGDVSLPEKGLKAKPAESDRSSEQNRVGSKRKRGILR